MASKLEENKRWIVTYTKHIRQKRKVYQDGVLEHHCSSNKILLYDDSGKLLDSRILRKDDLVECGVTLAFESHLVDICDHDETHKPRKDTKLHGSDEKSTEKAKIYGQISTNSSLGNKRIRLPTDRKVQNQLNPIPAAMREWDVLYTSQLTQKAKRYHDGILKLVSYGLHTNQLILLKEDGSVLSNKFQKSAECLSIGSTFEMPNYLLEICHERNMQEGNKRNRLPTDRKVQNQPNPIPAAMREWDVLYTSQITQKAKRYHDGILKFVSYGSHTNQLTLLKEDGSVLSNKFQKSAECLSIGSTFEMPNYLLEICHERNMQEGLEEPKDNPPDKKAVISSEVSRFTKGEEGSVIKQLHGDEPKDNPPDKKAFISSGVSRFTKGEEGSVNKQLHRDEPKDNPPDKKAFPSSGVSRFTKGEEGSVNKQLHRDASQILSALRRPPQQSLVPGNPLVDAACPRFLGLSHSDLPGCEISSDVPKLVNPDCEVELWTVNHSPSSSILYGEGPCKSPITNLGVDSTVKKFLHLGTSSIDSGASDAGGRICIKERHGSHAEEDCVGLNSNALRNKEHENNGTCSELHSDMDPENEEFEGFHSLSASGLDCAEAFPSINVDENSSELKTSPGEATMTDEYPSFDLGFEL